MTRLLLLVSLALTAALAAAQTRVAVRPLDFQNVDIADTLVQNVFQLDSRGDRILIRSENPYLIEIDREGTYLGKIGPVGYGSQTFQRISAFAVYGNQVATLNPKQRVFIYRDGSLFADFLVDKSSVERMFLSNAQSFGFDGRRVVLSARRDDAEMANAYSVEDGTILPLGTAAWFPDSLLLANPHLGGALWDWDGEHWYGLFKYKTVIRKFDHDFRLTGEFSVSGEEAAACAEKLYDSQSPSNRLRQLPFFSDMKVHRGHIYAICRNALYQIDAQTGETRQTFYFHGQGPDFENVPPEMPLAFNSFAFLEDGTLVLSHPALLWNHDLWLADLKARAVN